MEKVGGKYSPPVPMERSPSLEKQREEVELYRYSDLEELRN
jgi:hypothetical protein